MGIVQEEHAQEGITHVFGDLAHLVGIGGEFFLLEEEFLAQKPVAVAAGFPFGKVLGQDGTAAEVGLEDDFDFGELVELTGDGDGGLAGSKAFVDFIADGTREAGDFAVAFVVGVGG